MGVRVGCVLEPHTMGRLPAAASLPAQEQSQPIPQHQQQPTTCTNQRRRLTSGRKPLICLAPRPPPCRRPWGVSMTSARCRPNASTATAPSSCTAPTARTSAVHPTWRALSSSAPGRPPAAAKAAAPTTNSRRRVGGGAAIARASTWRCSCRSRRRGRFWPGKRTTPGGGRVGLGV